MSSPLDRYKSELVQTVTCELDMLQRGELSCANKMLKFRHSAQLRIFMIECMLAEENGYQTYKPVVNYLYEQVKEITRFISQSVC
jgi:hypothetical protein